MLWTRRVWRWENAEALLGLQWLKGGLRIMDGGTGLVMIRRLTKVGLAHLGADPGRIYNGDPEAAGQAGAGAGAGTACSPGLAWQALGRRQGTRQRSVGSNDDLARDGRDFRSTAKCSIWRCASSTAAFEDLASFCTYIARGEY